MVTHRKIIRIDEEKCDGCGQCVPACAEGALQIIDGKARLVSDVYCDGLGACLGECPRGALTIEDREAPSFDAQAVREHLARRDAACGDIHASAQSERLPHGCPGAASETLDRGESAPHAGAEAAPSLLGNWPVQIHLVPPQAPYLQGARLLIAADCVPFAYADFHRRFLADRVLLVGCPKLDDADFYRQKLAQILSQNDIRSIEIAHMEVPCCSGLVRVVGQALDDAGSKIPLTITKVGIRGGILDTTAPETQSEA